jgi:7-carboxy-7-deazaguanine synthase
MVLGYARVNTATTNGPLRLVSTPVLAVRALDPEPTIRIVLDDGTELLCSPDHRWWVEKLLPNGWVHKNPRRKGLEGNYRKASTLTPGQYIKGFGQAIRQPRETDMWRRGYLRGAFDGDGHISDAWIAMRVTSRSFFDAVVATSALVATPLAEYAEGVTTHGTPLYRSRLPEAARSAFMQAIEWQEAPEFARGYLAGMFDAEGHVPVSDCYYTQNQGVVCDRIQHALDLTGYQYRHWSSNGRSSRIYVDENPAAFLTQIDVRCAHKRAAAASRGMVRQRRKVVSVEAGPTVPLFDIQTGTENFLANGMVSHNCSWCDTLYAVLPEYKAEWTPMTAEAIMDEVRRLSGNQPILVTLSGGNPAIQPLGELIDLGHEAGYTFALETQGSVARPWFERLDYLTLSPKPPSSKQVTRWERLDRCVAYAGSGQGDRRVQVCLKVVVFDEEDYAYARYVAERYPAIPCYLQAGNHTPPHLAQEIDIPGILSRMDWLIQRVTEDRWFNVTVLPQMHALLWGNKRGV